MRINAHAHIFNLRSVFSRETLHILLNRLKLDGMPKSFLDVLHDYLEKYLVQEMDAEAIIAKLVERTDATKELTKIIEKMKIGGASLDIEIDGALAKLGEAASSYLRDKLLDLHDLDERGNIEQNLFDYIEFLRIAMMPSIEKVADEVMGLMKPEDALIALTMDITDGSDTDEQIKRQINDTADAVLAYPGRIFPFYMVNPLRPSHFSLMQNAIESQGFWGVKLYHSLGYPVVSDKMFAVYQYCQDHDIPILSHCTAGGFNKNTVTAPMAHPAHWGEVLDNFPNLKICFGHFGDSKNLIYATIPPDSWTQTIIDMMRAYKGVYTDISYNTDPMLGDKNAGISKAQAKQNFARHVKALLNDVNTRDRILFGTDFWLVRMVCQDNRYWSYFKKLFTDIQFKRMTEDNPIAYLGLPDADKPSQWLIEKHLEFFNSKKMRVQRAPAEWLNKAAQTFWVPAKSFVVIGTGPSWTINNYIHQVLYEYLMGAKQFRKADRDAKLPFEDYGRLKLANLIYWDESADPAIFDAAVRGVASDINKMYRKRYKKWTRYNTANGITEVKARKRLIAALSNPDWYVYQLAELCDKLYIFNAPLPQ